MSDDPAVRVRAWLDAPTWLPDAADDLRAVLAELLEYRNAITWETSCLACSRMLDACRATEERAERAEAELTENAGVLQALRRQRDTAEEQVRRVRVVASRDGLSSWDRERLANALDPPPPLCPRCHGRGKIPDFSQGLDPIYGEPKGKPCPDCRTEETPA